jgi:hypothetical protein
MVLAATAAVGVQVLQFSARQSTWQCRGCWSVLHVDDCHVPGNHNRSGKKHVLNSCAYMVCISVIKQTAGYSLSCIPQNVNDEMICHTRDPARIVQ